MENTNLNGTKQGRRRITKYEGKSIRKLQMDIELKPTTELI
jgi:hypothetical protein